MLTARSRRGGSGETAVWRDPAGRMISGGGRFTVETEAGGGSRLTVRDCEAADSGEYQCTFSFQESFKFLLQVHRN